MIHTESAPPELPWLPRAGVPPSAWMLTFGSESVVAVAEVSGRDPECLAGAGVVGDDPPCDTGWVEELTPVVCVDPVTDGLEPPPELGLGVVALGMVFDGAAVPAVVGGEALVDVVGGGVVGQMSA